MSATPQLVLLPSKTHSHWYLSILKQPVMFTLSEEEQLLAGNQFMRLLIKRAGSLKEAIPYAIGRKKLEEIGIHNEFEKELKIMRYDSPLKLLSTNNDA